MGLLDMLLTQGSPFTAAPNGSTPPTNQLATQQSQLHADGNQPGYSLNGSDFSSVNSAYQAYNDGAVNFLPQPSQLDLNGQVPSISTNPGSSQLLPYTSHLPG
jgi:hypothetical protein